MLVGDAGGVRRFLPFTRAFLSTCRTHRDSSGRNTMEEAGGGLAIVAEEDGSDDLATQAPDGSTRCHINCYDCDVTPPSPPPVKTPPSSPCTPCGGRKRGGGGDELFREEPDGDRIAHFFVPLTSPMMGEAIGAKKCSIRPSNYDARPFLTPQPLLPPIGSSWWQEREGVAGGPVVL